MQGVVPAGVSCFFCFFGGLALHINDSFRVQLTDFKIPGQPAWRISRSFFFFRFPGGFGYRFRYMMSSIEITSELCTQIHLRDLPAHPSKGVTCVFFLELADFFDGNIHRRKKGDKQNKQRNKAKPNQTKSNKQQNNKQTKPTNQTTKQTLFFLSFWRPPLCITASSAV